MYSNVMVSVFEQLLLEMDVEKSAMKSVSSQYSVFRSHPNNQIMIANLSFSILTAVCLVLLHLIYTHTHTHT